MRIIFIKQASKQANQSERESEIVTKFIRL